MKLRHTIIATTCITITLFAFALASALFGMQSSKNRFQRFLEVDQALLHQESTMYSQGLQMGQALRNIALNRTDDVARTNLERAAQVFNNALEQAQLLATEDPQTQQRLTAISSLKDQLYKEQAYVLERAHTPVWAAEAIRTKETPIWRELRTLLVESIAERQENVTKIKEDITQFSQKILIITLIISLLGAAIITIIMSWLTRHLLRLIGGEPEAAITVANAITEGDFTQAIPLVDTDKHSLMYSMQKMQYGLTAMTRRIQKAAESIDISAQEISLGNGNLSERTSSQAANLEQTAAAMEELTSTVRLNADNAAEANRLAAQASDMASRSGQAVSDAVSTMNEIRDSSERIVDIIGVIDSIAFQTNILALNAAVEAARAGEQGRGFAVVASEVRSLAQRSASAAQDVKTLIDASVERIAVGNEQITIAGSSVDTVVSSIKDVAGIMDEITNASREQSVGIGEIGMAVTQMDDTTQQNASLVQEAMAATSSLSEQATRLKSMAAEFRLPAN
ncbi:methyl-accepting chemotaxis protein [uncultured Paenalcaligenes sp.]|uniref:methyl-accepting chemotaxis protein n=1 Tax=uncultured Paenalcaligenes sp. TaxID=1588925 RepID=UPI00260C69FD|nr:methyl-accepting chemotaxis protein [uncultured Paenalcaligenes sp.]